MRYEWGHHGSEPECPHISVVKGGEPLPDDSFSSYRTGRIEDIFDLRLYGQADGTAEEQGWFAESQAALEAMVELANVGAQVMAAGGDTRMSAFREAIVQVQAMVDGFDIPEGEDEREDFLVEMDSEDYGRFAMLENVLDALQILALGGTPAQGR